MELALDWAHPAHICTATGLGRGAKTGGTPSCLTIFEMTVASVSNDLLMNDPSVRRFPVQRALQRWPLRASQCRLTTGLRSVDMTMTLRS